MEINGFSKVAVEAFVFLEFGEQVGQGCWQIPNFCPLLPTGDVLADWLQVDAMGLDGPG